MGVCGTKIHIVSGTVLSLPAEQQGNHWVNLVANDGTSVGMGKTTLALLLNKGHIKED